MNRSLRFILGMWWQSIISKKDEMWKEIVYMKWKYIGDILRKEKHVRMEPFSPVYLSIPFQYHFLNSLAFHPSSVTSVIFCQIFIISLTFKIPDSLLFLFRFCPPPKSICVVNNLFSLCLSIVQVSEP